MATSDSSASGFFHEGETAVQERCGVRERIEQIAPAILRGTMPEQHQEFFSRLPTLLVGSIDEKAQPWASILAGWPGFVRALDEKTLRVDAKPLAGDPLGSNLSRASGEATPLGLLGIEPETRRRNRLNGSVIEAGDGGFSVSVDQSFGNCPQYIQGRRPEWQRDPADFSDPRPCFETGALLEGAAAALVGKADTFYIASSSASPRAHAGPQGVDISHRGGKAGFVRVSTAKGGAASLLTIPDFRGNFLFNTLGNLTAHPRAGLLFLDYDSGDLLQLACTTRIVWDGAELAAFAGAQRLLELEIDGGIFHPEALPLRWSEPVFASQLRDTGDWTSSGR